MHSVIKAESLKPVAIYSIPRGKTEVQVEALEGVLDGMPVYFGSVNITKTRYAVAGGLIADAVGLVGAILIGYAFYH